MKRIRIKMLKTVRPDVVFPFQGTGDLCTVLEAGKEYDAVTNRFGAISGICLNGKPLGVKPEEFEFLEAPAWVLNVHHKSYF